MNVHQYTRSLQIIGHAFFFILMIWSLLFYQERMIAFDSGYYAFSILCWEDFFIANGRIISYISQLLPVLAFKLGFSLKTFLLLFSLSFILFYYLIFNIVVHGFKNAKAGIFMALSLCLLIRYKFFIGVSETPSTIALAALLVGWMTKDAKYFPNINPWWNAGIAIGLMLLLLLGHPMIVMPLLIFLGFDLIYNKKWTNLPNWLIIAGTGLAFYFKFKNISASSYEGGRLSILEDGPEVLANLQDYYIYQIALDYLKTDYYLATGLFIVLVGVLLWQKRVLSALFILLTSALLFAILMITCSYINSPIYSLIDGYFGYLGMAWSVLIFYVVVKNSKRYTLNLGLIIFVLAFSLYGIYTKKAFFSDRISQIETWLEDGKTADSRKLLVHARYFDWDEMWYPWAIPFESVLLSSIENPDSTATIYIRRWDDHFVDKIPHEEQKTIFLGAHFEPYEFSMEHLNRDYFRLDDKDGKYEYVGKNWSKQGGK